MPTSIATTIARQLETDPAETDRVLEDLIQNVRHDVARDGEAVVPGLGTFRLFNGTIAFEPDYRLALSVNHRYAGLEPLLVNDREHTHQVPASHSVALSSGSLHEAEPADDDLGVPSLSIHPEDETPGPPAERTEVAEDAEPFVAEEAEPFTEEDTDVPPPEDTELVVTFETPEDESLPEVTGTEPPAVAGLELAPPETLPELEEPLDERAPADALPDVLGEFASARPAVPAFDEAAPESGDEEALDEEEESAWAEAAPEGEEDHVWAGQGTQEEPEASEKIEFSEKAEEPEPVHKLEAPVGSDETEAPEEPEVHQEPGVQPEEVYPEPPALGAQLTSASPFFEPWPEDLPSFKEEPVAQVFPDEPEEPPLEAEPPIEMEPPENLDLDETNLAVAADEVLPPHPEADDFETWNPEQPEPEPSADFSPSDLYDPEQETQELAPVVDTEEEVPGPVALVPEAAETDRQDPLSAAAVTPSEPEAEEHRRSAVGWLIGAIALIAVLSVLYLLLIPRHRPVPPATPPVAENTTPATSTTDTTSSSAVMDTAGAAAGQPEPAPHAAPSEETAAPASNDANASPLKRPGGIDASAGGVTLIVASTPSRTSADAAARRFRDLGYTTAIFYGDYGGVTRYRVGVGQFRDEASAEAQRGRLPGAFPEDTWLMRIRSDMEVYQ